MISREIPNYAVSAFETLFLVNVVQCFKDLILMIFKQKWQCRKFRRERETTSSFKYFIVPWYICRMGRNNYEKL